MNIRNTERRQVFASWAAALMIAASLLLAPAASVAQAAKPNSVLVLMDNLGYGELGV